MAAWLNNWLAEHPSEAVGVFADPAPYNMPAIDLAQRQVMLLAPSAPPQTAQAGPAMIVAAQDTIKQRLPAAWDGSYVAANLGEACRSGLLRPAIISWADKPIIVYIRRDLLEDQRPNPPGAV